MDAIDEIVLNLLDGRRFLNYRDASYAQMHAVEEILNERTSKRPHGNMSFSEHMRRYVRDGYCLLGYQGLSFCSWRQGFDPNNERSITVSKFLELAQETSNESSVSKTEFDSVF